MIRPKMLVIGVIAVLAIVGLVTSDTFTAETATSTTDDIVTEESKYDGYVKFEGFDGESMDKDHKGWCDILAFEQGVSKPSQGASGSTRRRGAVIFEDIVIVKELDKTSPKLQEACWKGNTIPKVEIHITEYFRDAGDVVIYQYELKNVMITSYLIGSEDVENEYPTETMTLNFEEIKITYTECDSEGKKKGNVETEFKVEKGE